MKSKKTQNIRYFILYMSIFILLSSSLFIGNLQSTISNALPPQTTSQISTFTDVKSDLPVSPLTSSADSPNTFHPSADDSWTFMVYLDADNNLESAGIDDINEVERGFGTSGAVNVIVLIDRIDGFDTSNGDWTGGRYYEIVEDFNPSINSIYLSNLGEVAMDDPDTLENFITYCMTNYPADHYCLDIWDHGGGVFGACWDDTSGGNNFLSLHEIQLALNGALSGSEKIDVLTMDCCVMNVYEAAYEFRDFCDYFVASEDSVPFDGYDYELIISALDDNPDMTSEDLSSMLVAKYQEAYSQTSSVCLSAIDIREISSIVPYVDNFVGNITFAVENYGYDYLFYKARQRSQNFFDGAFIDIIDFAEKIAYYVSLDSVVLAANDFIAATNAMIVSNWQQGNYGGSANGITIFLPGATYSVYYGACYDYANRVGYFNGMDWQAHTQWGEFVRFFYDLFELIAPDEPSRLYLDDVTPSQMIDKYQITQYRFSTLYGGIFTFNMTVLTGDVDFTIAAIYSNGLEFFASSSLINPDDASEEICRLYLPAKIYYIFIQGQENDSSYTFRINTFEIPTITFADLVNATGGSSLGDLSGRFQQDLHHFYKITVQPQPYTFILNNSLTANYQMNIYTTTWELIVSKSAVGIGNSFAFEFNFTEMQDIIIEIYAEDGSGSFQLSFHDPSTETSGPRFIALLSTLLIFPMVFVVYRKYQKSKK
ncbi:MAG: clostripain-related cysteine peptidase [Asgard group archaeon]|nr:clostripain-related cysteine peptidase [Asgard group archaeon]